MPRGRQFCSYMPGPSLSLIRVTEEADLERPESLFTTFSFIQQQNQAAVTQPRLQGCFSPPLLIATATASPPPSPSPPTTLPAMILEVQEDQALEKEAQLPRLSPLVPTLPLLLGPSSFISATLSFSAIEAAPAFKRLFCRFRKDYDYSFPNIPCAFCTRLLVSCAVCWLLLLEDLDYPLTIEFQVLPTTRLYCGEHKVAVCSCCKDSPMRFKNPGP